MEPDEARRRGVERATDGRTERTDVVPCDWAGDRANRLFLLVEKEGGFELETCRHGPKDSTVTPCMTPSVRCSVVSSTIPIPVDMGARGMLS